MRKKGNAHRLKRVLADSHW